MSEVLDASFSFKNFKIPQFSYKEEPDESVALSLNFSPSGLFNTKTKEFEVILNFSADTDDNKSILKLRMISTFSFRDEMTFDKVPDYFYGNALAIVFPYLRAFISTLTLQANAKMLKLDLLNLQGLAKPLRDNSKEI